MVEIRELQNYRKKLFGHFLRPWSAQDGERTKASKSINKESKNLSDERGPA